MKKLLLLATVLIFAVNFIYGFGPASVNLGSANNYVILACTAVTTTGVTSVTGNIGLSPAAASYITGFGLIMDPSGTYSTSSLVTGNIYAANYTDPTPSNLTTAISCVETAYTDAAGRQNPDYAEIYAGDLTGQTLIPGLYNWSTPVLISAGGLTFAGGPNDVWILQIAQDLTVANGAIITLTGGAQPQNIFWQVAGQTVLGTTVQFKGVVLCQTLISLNTSATVNGRLYALTAVTLNSNSVVQSSLINSIHHEEIPLTSGKSSLDTNYPNPFNPSTTISFNIAQGEKGNLTIYNFKGQSVLQKIYNQGNHNFVWNAQGLASGVYLARLKTNTQNLSIKMILIK